MASFAPIDVYHDKVTHDAWHEAHENNEPCPICHQAVYQGNWRKHMQLKHSDVIDPLSYDEARSLSTHEAVITAGLDMFYAVGKALATINEQRLYRACHKTFAAYCADRWNMSRQRGYQLIQAAGVIDNLQSLPMVDSSPPPLNERQAREIANLEPHEQRIVLEVVKQTAPKGKVTAQHLKSVKKVLKEVVVTHAIDDGTGEQIPVVSPVLKAAVIEETYERMKRQEIHIDESNARKEAKLAAAYTPPAESEPTAPTASPFTGSVEWRDGSYHAVIVMSGYKTEHAAMKAIKEVRSMLIKEQAS